MAPPVTSFLLPAAARAKVLAIEDGAASAAAMASATSRSIRELYDQITLQPETEEQCVAEIERLQGRLTTQQDKERQYADLANLLRQYLKTLPASAQIEQAPKIKPQTLKGETIPQAVDRVRGKIAELIVDRNKAQRAELPIADRKRQARAYVHSIAERSTPRVVADHGRFNVEFVASNYTGTLDIAALLAWLDPDAFIDRLCDQIDAAPKPNFALSTDERRDRLQLLADELQTLEFQECTLIEAAADNGIDIVHRVNPPTSPAAILGIRVTRGVDIVAHVTKVVVREAKTGT
jgi:hypothetical protein